MFSTESAHIEVVPSIAAVLAVALTSAFLFQRLTRRSSTSVQRTQNDIVPVAVNYHFTRKCNYKCGFCFHTAKTSHMNSLEDAKKILSQLRENGCRKINFAGGEPFLPEHRKHLGEMVKYCKEVCKYESVSIISNGTYITEEWFQKYAQYLDILGVSCDSSDESINEKIGRGKGNHVRHVYRASKLCQEYNVMFKLNTVVNAFNFDSDMSELVRTANPMRWKIFQVLPLDGENRGENTLRNVNDFLITDEQFQYFIDLHKDKVAPDIMKIENNDTMQSSYILVDEYGRFLDSSTGGKVPTSSILDVGVAAALRELSNSAGGGYNAEAFTARDGLYKDGWSKGSNSPCKVEDIEDLRL